MFITHILHIPPEPRVLLGATSTRINMQAHTYVHTHVHTHVQTECLQASTSIATRMPARAHLHACLYSYLYACLPACPYAPVHVCRLLAPGPLRGACMLHARLHTFQMPISIRMPALAPVRMPGLVPRHKSALSPMHLSASMPRACAGLVLCHGI